MVMGSMVAAYAEGLRLADRTGLRQQDVLEVIGLGAAQGARGWGGGAPVAVGAERKILNSFLKLNILFFLVLTHFDI